MYIRLLTCYDNLDAIVGATGVHVADIMATDPSILDTYFKVCFHLTLISTNTNIQHHPVDSSGPAALGSSEHLRQAINHITVHHLISSQAVLLPLLCRYCCHFVLFCKCDCGNICTLHSSRVQLG